MKIFLFVFAILNFIIFAIDIEYDKDVWTWFWLLNSQLFFLAYLIERIKDLLKKKE
jgi:hypothetical protein